MSRAYDPNIAPNGADEDEDWFEREPGSQPLPRKRHVNWILGLASAGVLIVGYVLGAFSSGEGEATTALEALRERARAAEAARPLGGGLLVERMKRLPAWVTPSAKPAVEAAPPEAKPDEVVADAEPVEAKPIEAKPVETKPVEAKPAETKPAAAKPAETKPVEAKPVEAKPAEAKPVEAKPVEAKPAETKPVETKPVEAKPVEIKPAETKPAETKPADPKAPANAVDQALAEAKALLDARKWAEAKAAYDKALGLSPGNTKALFGRGRALFEQRQLPPAMKDLEAVLAAEPKHPNALLMAGSIAQELGRKDDARKYYQRYLEAWPEGRKAAEVKNLLERL